MLSLMQPRLSAMVFQMFTNVLEYGASQFTPGLVKSISDQQNIDWNYLNKVIEGSKEQRQQKKYAVNIKFKKDTSAAKTHTGGATQTSKTAELAKNLDQLDLSDDEDTNLTPEIAGSLAQNLDFYRK